MCHFHFQKYILCFVLYYLCLKRDSLLGLSMKNVSRFVKINKQTNKINPMILPKKSLLRIWVELKIEVIHWLADSNLGQANNLQWLVLKETKYVKSISIYYHIFTNQERKWHFPVCCRVSLYPHLVLRMTIDLSPTIVLLVQWHQTLSNLVFIFLFF